MGTKAAASRKQSKAMKVVLATIRTFSKVKDFYMVSLEQFGNGVAGNSNPQAPTLARSYSVSSARKASNVENQAGLPRSMSESRSKSNYGVGSYVHNNNNNQKKGLGYGYDNELMKRSCSVGGKKMMMRKIDEDDSCSFREEDVTAHLIYPRSKSYSLNKSSSYIRLG
ncbi:hypothetical protein HS088_TW17G00761 [Tripterygium wilfordii]|uniref:Uncharacterized protein n=1 Tax=Tripterygium wilfordii TaxID=458696 RepID=A0A7J7CGR5_TRIWF|nr:hypothetical protein HS088_TW17G00761 [Tripterygium wilfordii]